MLCVTVHLSCADVLAHSHRCDRVKRTVVDIPIILQSDLDAVVKPSVVHALLGQQLLLLAEGDADDVDAVVLRGVDGQGTPAASDVE